MSQKRYVYWWADGVYFNVRLDEERTCVLVLIGATEDGTKEAFAALGQAADMETYRPDEPSGTSTGYITSKVDGKKYRVAIANFGMQDAAPARKFGRSLVRAGYNSGQAEAEIWRAAWQRYPNDRFFARCFAQQAEQAYANAVK